MSKLSNLEFSKSLPLTAKLRRRSPASSILRDCQNARFKLIEVGPGTATDGNRC